MSCSPQPLSRTTSLTSEAFSGESKRTRKRFAKWQTTALEKLYATTTHPSREERETLANHIEADLRAVTVWFQNKRQTLRKTLGNTTNRRVPVPLANYPAHAHQRPLASHSSAHLSAHSLSSASAKSSRTLTRTASGFSLDLIASRSELVPRTPRKLSRHKSLAASAYHSTAASDDLWDAMPSSPVNDDSPARPKPGGSPAARNYVDFASRRGARGPSRRTLEWACAAARIAPEKEEVSEESIPATTPPLPSLAKAIGRARLDMQISEDEDEYDVKTGVACGTEDEDDEDAKTEIVETEAESVPESHEAITPQPSFTFSSCTSSPSNKTELDSAIFSARIHSASTGKKPKKPVSKDNATMSAAWALCGMRSMSTN